MEGWVRVGGEGRGGLVVCAPMGMRHSMMHIVSLSSDHHGCTLLLAVVVLPGGGAERGHR
jgi:hypothetical protein